MRWAVGALMLAAACSGPTWATVEHQVDSRRFERTSIDAAGDLPLGVAAFGFLDVEPDGAGWFARGNLSREVLAGIAPVIEAQGQDGFGTRSRAGVAWTVPVPGVDFVRVLAFPIQEEGGSLLRVVHEHRFAGTRYSIGGFFDVVPDWDGRAEIVTEQQARADIAQHVQAFVEAKANTYLSADDELGVGIGVRLVW